jgi:hypothetical protein
MPEYIMTVKGPPKLISAMQPDILKQIEETEKLLGSPVNKKMFPGMFTFIFTGTKEEMMKLKQDEGKDGKAKLILMKASMRLVGIKISTKVNLSDKSEVENNEL